MIQDRGIMLFKEPCVVVKDGNEIRYVHDFLGGGEVKLGLSWSLEH